MNIGDSQGTAAMGDDDGTRNRPGIGRGNWLTGIFMKI